MRESEDVLILVLVLIGVALAVIGPVVGFGMQLGQWVKDKPPWKLGLVTASFGTALLVLAYVLPYVLHTVLEIADGEKKAESLTAIGTVAGDVVTAILAATTLYAVILLRRAVNEQVKELRASAVQNVGHEMLRIDRWTAEHPEHLKAIALPADKKSDEGEALAEIYADFIDQVVSQAEYLPDGHVPVWEEYFDDIIVAWPQLRKYMVNHREWYLDAMNQLLDRDPPPLVTGIPAVCIPVTDYEGTLEFFISVLGMKKLLDTTYRGGERWVTLIAPGSDTRVVLRPSKPAATHGEELGSLIRLTTTDARTAHKRLPARGNDLPRLHGWPPTFAFNGPAGISLEIRQNGLRAREAKRPIVAMPAIGISIPIAKQDAVIDFYTKKLDLIPEKHRHIPRTRHGVAVGPAHAPTQIFLKPTDPAPGGSKTGIRLATTDAAAARRRLLAEYDHSKVGELRLSEDLREMFTVDDPADNELTIIQMATRSLVRKSSL